MLRFISCLSGGARRRSLASAYSAIAIIIGHLLLAQGAKNERKKRVARRFLSRELAVLRMNCAQVLAADMAAMEEYALLAGPVPAAG